jgi:GTP cyclohydrolase I
MEWKHFCMIARWVEKQNSIMKTSDLRWAFKEDWKSRQELFNLINK